MPDHPDKHDSPVKLTKTVATDAKAVPFDYFVWDTELSGFGLKIAESGRRSFVLQYRTHIPGKSGTRPRRLTLGPFPTLTVEQARNEARKLAAEVALGDDPLANRDKRRAELDRQAIEAQQQALDDSEQTIAAMMEQWLTHYEATPKRNGQLRRATNIAQARTILRTHLLPILGDRPIRTISSRDALKCIETIPPSRPASRRNLYSYARVFFGWAANPNRAFIPSNPFAELGEDAPAPAPKRQRRLEQDEIADIWNASGKLDAVSSAYIRLLLITGQRRNEVARMDWSELDRLGRAWTIPMGRAKNSQQHYVRLNRLALAEIDAIAGGNEWANAGPVLTNDGVKPIGGFSALKKRLDAELPDNMASFVIHDLRRAMATQSQIAGVDRYVVEAAINHKGSKSDLIDTYQLDDLLDDRRDALDLWAEALSAIIIGERLDDFVNERGERSSQLWRAHIRSKLAATIERETGGNVVAMRASQ